MSKYKVSIKDSYIRVKYKLGRNETIKQSDIDVFSSKFIRGLMRPKVVSNKRVEYSSPGNTTLKQYLGSGLSKKDFYVVFAQFVECVKKIERYGFDINNLVMDTDYTFYNDLTREVQFLYQPINPPEQKNIFSYINEIIRETVINLDESTAFLNDLLSFVNSQKLFSSVAFENYLISVYPQVYKTVKRMKPGDSTTLNPTGRTYFEKKYEETGRRATDKDTFINNYNDVEDSINDEDATSLLIDEENLDTDVLIDNEGDTSILGEDEGTTVLHNEWVSCPYIIRLNTYEKIMINKPVFRIGKEKSYVDYFVSSNNAVSRIHADIVKRDNHYYIKDNNSTNHTFVNGTMIGVNQNVEIFDNDSIMLANEPFEFHIG